MSIKVRFSLLVTKSVVYCVLGSIYDTHSLIPPQFSNFSRWLLFASQYIPRSTHVTFCWRNFIKQRNKRRENPITCQAGWFIFLFCKEVHDCRRFLRLVLWTSSLFCEGKTMCIKTCLKCDFLVDPFVVWNQANYSGNCCELQVSRSSLNKVGITCYVAN